VPTYQYACTECGHELEAVQKFSDEPLTECPSCSGRLRKRFSAVGVVFKGSGFYRTDSRAKSSSSDAAAEPKSAPAKSESVKTASGASKSGGEAAA
jgi:putative FmdB family regulatory protein